ncbi:hypothetical protein CYD26_05310 [Pseudomonas sp. FFUP_PS_473]|uniref:hypothetical protein n=1 Tax=Pseudomonas sp. FFUP_PS_473 TaxID=2060418 RepID=UPI000C79D26C|nr:hypothetical protein [Pseudomonas sp. FFUP_PS_473]PLP95271.1 hypothetical protein CYD26_05310 [Pseudomonas sp. FFUP_PS_473]
MNFVLKESVLAGLIGGAIAACLAFLVNQYLVPFPQSVLDNSLGNGISGFISGLLSGFIGVFLVLRKVGKTN